MSLISRTRRHWLLSASLALAVAAAGSVLLVPDGSSAQEALVATSVCEAQKLKERKKLDPDLVIEIPPEHDKTHPSLEACIAHDEAWNENNEGLRQPIPFSHKHHAGYLEMDCQYCHYGARSAWEKAMGWSGS